MKRAFCTYFDHRYLSRGLSLIASLREHGCNNEVWVLCLSEECRRALVTLALPGVRLVTPADIEVAYPELLRVKAERSPMEYYFTCSPHALLYVLDKDQDANTVVYLDADLYFFEPAELVFREIDDAPVAITPHNFSSPNKFREKFGLYNVSWVSFRRTDEGVNCLKWWAERCLEWCHDDPAPDGRFADQGYLNWFPEIAPHLRVLTHPGINLAPWNIANYHIEQKQGRILADGAPLIFFHFHGVKRHFRWFYFNFHKIYRAPFPSVLRNYAYKPYVAELIKWETIAAQALGTTVPTAQKLGRGTRSLNVRKPREVVRDLLDLGLRVADLISGRAILVIDKSVY